ncbi:MAG: amino acid adenylation domain-containing protein [Candidatus Aminicenantes bacterium]|nr:amino acid adenylation domain-containing protein [Candidatus Aminicenantes bacterium]NIM78475.1 amino acid adenylation domain-containing protein [Candidatus Aminicenantes bacterium]NIN17736.1 amino acid adenylation domain-containing protein [Candidatus Aminicenantes bacterium]NIN41612.1 amino acid adenylation domain-containing protein [Candidatus Aminicenantes bacterium]NIN84386.1 amino acid adenylation domain-containing protein [Candidatus Aminicenantes bacterium]
MEGRTVSISRDASIASSQFAKEREYWLNKLSGELIKSYFPYDYNKTKTTDSLVVKKNSVFTSFSGEEFSGLMRLSRGVNYTLHMIAAAVVVVLLDKYAYDSNKDIIIGAPIYKQEIDADTEFVNTVLALRVQPEENITFKELLLQVRQTMLEADDNKNYPIEVLLSQLNMSMSEYDFPLFDVAVLLENIHDMSYLRSVNLNMIFCFRRTEESMEMEVQYNVSRYERETVERIASHFTRLLQQVLLNVDLRLTDVDIASEEERKQLIKDFNDAVVEYPRKKTIQELFVEQCERTPDHIAVVGALGANTVSLRWEYLTYKELNKKSDQMAHVLREKGVGPDEVVGLMVERTVEMIIGIMGILKAGGAYMPIAPDYPRERIDYMLEDSKAALLLTARDLLDVCRSTACRASICKGTACCAPINLAYVMYTSGSTGRPKGVMVEHGNVVNLVWGLWERIYKRYTGAQKVALVAPYVFDASVQQIFAALLLGHTLYIIPEETRIDGAGLIDYYRKHRIEISDGTPTHLRLMVDAASGETPYRGLNTKHFIIGGEPMPRRTVEAFLKGFPDDGDGPVVSNVYGPTECCVDSTSFDVSAETLLLCQGDIIPIGKPMPNEQIFILGNNNSLQPMGVPGELCIAGDGVSRGYLGKEDLTAERFLYISKKIYKTGDLARWLPDGNIEFLGRLDHQVKVRGFRIELGEIENLLLDHEAVKEAVAVDAGDGTGDKVLCAYIVVDREFENIANAGEFREHLSRMLPDYMIPSYFVFLEKLPLTPNGKVDRKSLPEPDIGLEEEYVAPHTFVEKKLVEIWADILKIDQSKIGIDTGFFNIGGQSLKATVLISEIHKQLHVKIPLVEVFKTPTIRELSRFIAGAEVSTYTSIEKVPEQKYYPLSFAQRRLWVLCQFEEDSTAYNMPWVFAFSGPFDVEAFTKAVQAVADRHESLRTVFVVKEGEPKQKIIRDFRFQLGQVDLMSANDASDLSISQEIEEQARKVYVDFANSAFDLKKGPLFKFNLVRFEGQRYLLMFNIHHIITDGWSTGTLFNEMIILYNAFSKDQENPLPPLRLQYKDYSAWHNALIEKGSFDRSGSYWLDKFKDKPNGIELPLDHPRGVIQTFNGGRVPFVIDEEKSSALHRIGREEDVTLFMVLLSLVNLFMYRYTGQEDILIGSPIAGRRSPELHPLVGFLVNTLVYRNRVEPLQTFRQLLENIKKEALECFEYQDYPFDLLVERLELDRDLSRSPLFNVMLAHNNAETEDTNLVVEGIRGESYPYSDDFNMSKFDLIFFMDEYANHIVVRIEYNSDLFERRTIERMSANFLAMVEDITQNSLDRPLHEVNCLAEAEYETVVHRFNHNREEFSQLTIQELFEQQVEKTGDAIAVVSPDGQALSYAQLNYRANQLAHYLREEFGVKPGDIVGICSDRSLEMMVILLGIVKAGGGYVSIDPNFPGDRVLHMLKDSRAQWVVVDQVRPELFEDYITKHGGTIIDYSTQRETIGSKSPENPQIMNTLSEPLYVIYTSGSTGTPNGAMLSQGILSNLVWWQQEKAGIDASLRCLQFTSINFCVSFQEIFITLTAGGQVHLIGDIERQDIDYLMDFLVTRRVELLYLPFSYLNFLFNESSRWEAGYKMYLKHIITAGEQLKITSGLKQFLESNPGIQLHNHYGSSEMHVVTSYTLDASTVSLTPVPPAGEPIANTCIYILDESNNPVPVGVWGELCIAGSWEVLGYIHNPQLTDEKLFTHPVFSAENDNKRLYRSGDIGRWLADGNIELKGRKDFQVKIRGFRVEPAEIESKILAISEVTDCVVVVREESSESEAATTVQHYLVAYVVVEGIDGAGIKRIISNELPQYMVPKIVILDRLPLMPNGKVDREMLPDPGFVLDHLEGYVAPENDIQGELAAIWSELLGIDAERIGIDDNFFEKGGHSLKATTMMSKIHKELNVKVDLLEIFKSPTIRDLSRYIEGLKEDVYTSITPVEEREYYPLSSAQKRLFVLQQLVLESTAYNMPVVVVLEGELDREKLESTFRQMIESHESLRTSFQLVQKGPVQKIWAEDRFEFSLEYYDLAAGGDPAGIIGGFIRPFDLSQAPLFRVGLIHTPPLTEHPSQEGISKDKYILMIDMHHIISDGVSMGIFVQDFMAFYSGGVLPASRVQYKDFSQWQNRLFQSKEMKRQESFWLQQFENGVPVLELPCDYTRPAVATFTGSRMGTSIGAAETAALKQMALKENVTLFMALMVVFNILFSKLSGQDDIVIGTPIAGRRDVDIGTVIGMFVNTLALRNFPDPEKPILTFIHEVKERTLQSFANQDYPFEELVDKLEVARDTSRNPLFDVMFSMQNTEISPVEIRGLTLKPYAAELNIAKFDMIATITDYGDVLYFDINYCTALFKPETIRGFFAYFTNVLTSVLESPCRRISDVQIMTEAEKRQVLYDFNQTAADYPAEKTIHELFNQQAERTPDGVAVVGSWQLAVGKKERNGEMVQITYGELNQSSNRLAHLLKEKGVLADSIIGIMTERSVEMIIGILGILKAGGAYLPIDPDYPQDRINYMLKDSSAAFLLTAGEIMDVFKGTASCAPTISPAACNLHLSLAYIIYTSGSTGRPKGVMVAHTSVVNLIMALQEAYPLEKSDAYLLKTNYTFDVSAAELFGWYLGGGRLAVLEKGGEKDPGKIMESIEREGITHANFVPSMFRAFLAFLNKENVGKLSSLRYIFLAGEALSPEPVSLFRNLNTSITLENIYGPTEGTVYAAQYSISQWNETGSIPIGKPLQNVRIYILDKAGHVQTIGVPGELCLSGIGLSRGYLNRPELTTEKFVGFPEQASPFPTTYSPTHLLTHSTIYRTGDLARWLPDGNIKFLGRMDFQVKIRGYRIELGEIENCLLKHPHVKEAVVLSRTNEIGTKFLCAYVTLAGTLDKPAEMAAEFKNHLSHSLPNYMIPTHFVLLEKIPKTANGKIDRKALPQPVFQSTADYIMPKTLREKRAAGIWRELLEVENVGVDDNFFELGGNSLNIIQLGAQLKETLQIDVPTVVLFRFPTIRTFLGYLQEQETGAPEDKSKMEKEREREKVRLKAVNRGKHMMKGAINKREGRKKNVLVK